MARSASDDYGSFGSVPDQTRVDGSGAQPMGVRANPEDFGAAVGAGISKLGATTEEIANHYQEMAVHTATNDAYVNGYAPAVNSLVSNYKKLSGTEALQQLPVYQKQLKDLNAQYLDMGSPMQKELMGGLVARHTISTMDNMTNHADQQYTQHEQIVTAQSIKNASDEAVNNINDPKQVDFQVNRAIGVAKLEGLRKVGYAAEGADHDVVDQLAKEAGSNVASSVIKAAIDVRDYQSANAYYSKYASILSGNQKLELSKSLTNLNTINNADSIIDNIVTGKPAIPQGTPQFNDVQKKADVAQLAQKEGFDPDIMFGLHGAESNHGKSITADSRLKDDFQTDPKYRDKGFEGDDLASSVHNAAFLWKQNVPALEKNIGRAVSPKEGYVAYNQGGAGATALFNAKTNETAVQALSKIMDPNTALKHVLQNGGTPTMAASDFSNHLQDWFQNHYEAQKTSITDGKALPDAIREHADVQLPAVQPTTNPHDFLEQYSERMPSLRSYGESIPDYATRDAFNKKVDGKFAQAKMDDSAWKIGQAKVAQQYAEDPRYASLDEVPQTVKNDLQKAGQLKFLETALTDKNNPKKDPGYGAGFLPVLNRISSDDPVDRIADIAGLQQVYGDKPDLHTSGFKQLSGLIKATATPEGRAKVASQAQFLSDLRQKIGGADEAERQANFERALPLFFNSTNDSEMSLDPANKNSFVTKNNIKVMTPAEQTTKKINDSVNTVSELFGARAADNTAEAVKARTAVAQPKELTLAEQVQKQLNTGKITPEEANAQFLKLGIQASPQAPRPQ